MRTALFLFRRDLRLHDNRGLLYALGRAEEVIAAFVFTPEQIEKNPYRGDPALQFLIESLEDLEGQLEEKGGKLFLFYGKPHEVVERLIREEEIGGVFCNRDYTPYSKKRDAAIEKVCKQAGVEWHAEEDALLNRPEETVKGDQTPYTIFTPYFRNAARLEVAAPQRDKTMRYRKGAIRGEEKKGVYERILPTRRAGLAGKGGRREGLALLRKIGRLEDYKQIRDFPALDGTSGLSPHLKFTTLSPREVYWAIRERLGAKHDLIRSLYWRDFFTAIAHFFPEVFGASFQPKFRKLKWSYDERAFAAWCEGRTGFPLVDAGMRQLSETGIMHNRVRMVTASFLTKDLHIDWRWGEKWFAQRLIDYDPAVNNGNWQWSASTGCDAQPYFRIFNPWSQQEKFDPECVYIKRWVPELERLTATEIHQLHAEGTLLSADYPPPIVDHAVEAKRAIERFKKASHV
jgi:deoxyribodipyrimidine photo-lyase